MWGISLSNLLSEPIEFAYFEYQIISAAEQISTDREFDSLKKDANYRLLKGLFCKLMGL